MNLHIKKLQNLTSLELYELYKLRTDIFVVEQDCAYPEVDEADLLAQHVLGLVNEEVLACARVVPPGAVYEYPSIGRVAVRPDQRRKGYGRQVFDLALRKAQKLYPHQTLKIQAQVYLEKFYRDFGFETVSGKYLDAGVEHVDMLLKA